jgi:hypothetical protein
MSSGAGVVASDSDDRAASASAAGGRGDADTTSGCGVTRTGGSISVLRSSLAWPRACGAGALTICAAVVDVAVTAAALKAMISSWRLLYCGDDHEAAVAYDPAAPTTWSA